MLLLLGLLRVCRQLGEARSLCLLEGLLLVFLPGARVALLPALLFLAGLLIQPLLLLLLSWWRRPRLHTKTIRHI